MTRRRQLILASLSVLAAAGVLALPAVHWRLVGWARDEPFWHGMPASYWRAEVAGSAVNPRLRMTDSDADLGRGWPRLTRPAGGELRDAARR